MTFEEYLAGEPSLADHDALYLALTEGDLRPLILRLRDDGELTPRMKLFIADVLDKRWKKPRTNKRARFARMKGWVNHLVNRSRDRDGVVPNGEWNRAIGEVAEMFGVNQRTVETAMTASPEPEPSPAEIRYWRALAVQASKLKEANRK